jgi:hypothetical protein
MSGCFRLWSEASDNDKIAFRTMAQAALEASGLLQRAEMLEMALRKIDQLDVGVWPSWEMGRVARASLSGEE